MADSVELMPCRVVSADVTCRICTIHLEQLCYRRAWWFRVFREILATGVRLFAAVHRIRPEGFRSRSPACHNCLRFKKNTLKTVSPTFRRIDSWINPLFNKVRDSLLAPEELDRARAFALQAEDKAFKGLPGADVS